MKKSDLWTGVGMIGLGLCCLLAALLLDTPLDRSEEHTSELQSR